MNVKVDTEKKIVEKMSLSFYSFVQVFENIRMNRIMLCQFEDKPLVCSDRKIPFVCVEGLCVKDCSIKSNVMLDDNMFNWLL